MQEYTAPNIKVIKSTSPNLLLFIEFNISIDVRYQIMLTSILYKNKLRLGDSPPLQDIQYSNTPTLGPSIIIVKPNTSNFYNNPF